MSGIKIASPGLPAFVSKAVWYKLFDHAGTTISDTLGNGPNGTISGTSTQFDDNPGFLTLNNGGTPNAVRLTSSYVDSLCDLESLPQGHVIYSMQLDVDAFPASGTEALWYYGMIGASADENGGYGLTIGNGPGAAFNPAYSEKFVTPRVFRTGQNILVTVGDILARTITLTTVWNKFDGYVWVDGYCDGRYIRSTRLTQMGGAEPSASTTGLYLFAIGSGGSAGNRLGTTSASVPKVRNFVCARIESDLRHRVPKLMRDLAFKIKSSVPALLRAA